MTLSFRTDRSGQTVQTQIRVFTICYSICIFWSKYSMTVWPLCLNFRKFTAKFSGVEKQTNKGTDKQYVVCFLNTQFILSYLIFVPNFKILGQVVSEKSLTKISNSLHWSEARKGDKPGKKNAKINLSILFLVLQIHLVALIGIQNLKIPALIDAELIWWKIYWKERWSNM